MASQASSKKEKEKEKESERTRESRLEINNIDVNKFVAVFFFHFSSLK